MPYLPQVFGLPLRPAWEITDADIIALIRARAESGVALPPPRAYAPAAAASGVGTPLKAPALSLANTPSRGTPRPSFEVSDY